jgi:hypothetical protein
MRQVRACGRRRKALYTLMQMNGSRRVPEDLAKRRLFVGALPGMGEENGRGNDCLTFAPRADGRGGAPSRDGWGRR